MTTMNLPIFVLPPDMDPDARLAALETELANCARALDEGDVRRLDGVDKEVAILCRQVMEIPTGEAAHYIQRLQALSDAFTALGDAMAAQRDLLKDEMGELQARQKAHRAYGMRGVVAATDTKKDNEQDS